MSRWTTAGQGHPPIRELDLVRDLARAKRPAPPLVKGFVRQRPPSLAPMLRELAILQKASTLTAGRLARQARSAEHGEKVRAMQRQAAGQRARLVNQFRRAEAEVARETGDPVAVAARIEQLAIIGRHLTAKPF